MLFNVVGEPIFSYFYTTFILGAPEKAAKALASWNAITTSVNAIFNCDYIFKYLYCNRTTFTKKWYLKTISTKGLTPLVFFL